MSETNDAAWAAADDLSKLKWGVYLKGKIVMACRYKPRAEQMVAFGNEDTPGGGVEMREIDSTAIIRRHLLAATVAQSATVPEATKPPAGLDVGALEVVVNSGTRYLFTYESRQLIAEVRSLRERLAAAEAERDKFQMIAEEASEVAADLGKKLAAIRAAAKGE